MCYFVTISFPKKVEKAVISHLLTGVCLDRNKNPFFVQTLGKGFLSMNVTDGHCSCSLYSSLLTEDAEDTTRLMKKYRRKGWSQNKIDIALSNIERKPRQVSIDLRPMISSIAYDIGSVHLFAICTANVRF
jgi:hypothetical protein